MPEFHKILKDTRIQRGIELEEIQTRTKINIKFLKAIENGEYDLLPEPYIRLFLRAYSTEIGLDPKKILDEFEQFIDGKTSKSKGVKRNKKPVKRQPLKEIKTEKEIIYPKKSPKINRDKVIKSLILLACWIFGLIIIHKITNPAHKPTPTVVKQDASNFITNLNTNYHETYKEEQQLEFSPPYSLSIKTVSQLTILVPSDTSGYTQVLLKTGEHKSFYTDSTLSLILEHTQNVTLTINGESETLSIEKFQESPDPVKIEITADPPAYSVRQYTQKQ
jgi:transcriptional regulator with XRE-family HTH domain